MKAANLDTINMPTVAAMNFIYSAFYSLSSPHRTEPEHLCAELERVERDPLRSDEVLGGVVGLVSSVLLFGDSDISVKKLCSVSFGRTYSSPITWLCKDSRTVKRRTSR